MARPILLLLPLFLAGCPEQGVKAFNAEPEAEITSHGDGDEVAPQMLPAAQAINQYDVPGMSFGADCSATTLPCSTASFCDAGSSPDCRSDFLRNVSAWQQLIEPFVSRRHSDAAAIHSFAGMP